MRDSNQIADFQLPPWPPGRYVFGGLVAKILSQSRKGRRNVAPGEARRNPGFTSRLYGPAPERGRRKRSIRVSAALFEGSRHNSRRGPRVPSRQAGIPPGATFHRPIRGEKGKKLLNTYVGRGVVSRVRVPAPTRPSRFWPGSGAYRRCSRGARPRGRPAVAAGSRSAAVAAAPGRRARRRRARPVR